MANSLSERSHSASARDAVIFVGADLNLTLQESSQEQASSQGASLGVLLEG